MQNIASSIEAALVSKAAQSAGTNSVLDGSVKHLVTFILRWELIASTHSMRFTSPVG